MYRLRGTNTFLSAGLIAGREVDPLHVDVNIVENDLLDLNAVREWRGGEHKDAEFVTEADGSFRCGWQVEKMSKHYFNVVDPTVICDKYGADTLRLYEMFLGPLEDAKPWNTNGIEGSSRFLKRVWNLFTDEENRVNLSDEAPNKEELKALHLTIGKIGADIEQLSMNTSVSQFMIFVNEMARLKCKKRAVLEPFLILLAPFAPHIAEELWQLSGNTGSLSSAAWPEYFAEYTKSDMINYPVQLNGKVRAQIQIAADLTTAEIEAEVMQHPDVQAVLAG